MKIVLFEEEIVQTKVTYNVDEDKVPKDEMNEVIDKLQSEELSENDINSIHLFCGTYGEVESAEDFDRENHKAVSVEDYTLPEGWIEHQSNNAEMEAQAKIDEVE